MANITINGTVLDTTQFVDPTDSSVTVANTGSGSINQDWTATIGLFTGSNTGTVNANTASTTIGTISATSGTYTINFPSCTSIHGPTVIMIKVPGELDVTVNVGL